MGRKPLFEFEDLPWFPRLIRAYMQDHLTFMGNLSGPAYQGFVEKLQAAMACCGQRQLLDLCSGSGGPARTILPLLYSRGMEAKAWLSDLFPNVAAYRHLAKETNGAIEGVEYPVDAAHVPADLTGFRLVANGFHHFRPTQAVAVLADAVAKRQGIAVIEMVNRSPFAFLSVGVGFLSTFLAAPFLKPFRATRLVYTYLLPLVPLFLLWDGVVSCLRVYSLEELRGLVSQLNGNDYEWDIGKIRIGPGAVTYLIGTPGAPQTERRGEKSLADKLTPPSRGLLPSISDVDDLYSMKRIPEGSLA
ncbi:MAG TPA: class I SAM-dependent methyltransferase [Methylomirabilota bacterium]|nr:class I SAM-dependent methyltransferase [Methylomirabilota bacterium]